MPWMTLVARLYSENVNKREQKCTNKGSVPWYPRSKAQYNNAVNDSTIKSSISWWHGWHLFHYISLDARTVPAGSSTSKVSVSKIFLHWLALPVGWTATRDPWPNAHPTPQIERSGLHEASDSTVYRPCIPCTTRKVRPKPESSGNNASPVEPTLELPTSRQAWEARIQPAFVYQHWKGERQERPQNSHPRAHEG